MGLEMLNIYVDELLTRNEGEAEMSEEGVNGAVWHSFKAGSLNTIPTIFLNKQTNIVFLSLSLTLSV